jgi:hypothetical protein
MPTVLLTMQVLVQLQLCYPAARVGRRRALLRAEPREKCCWCCFVASSLRSMRLVLLMLQALVQLPEHWRRNSAVSHL